MKARKTVKVKDIVERANLLLASKEEIATKEFKMGIIAMLEHALHEAKAYRGFVFIDNSDSKVDTLGYCSRKYFQAANQF